MLHVRDLVKRDTGVDVDEIKASKLRISTGAL